MVLVGAPGSLTQKLLRWPILIVVFTILGLEFGAYLFVRFLVALFELSSRLRFRKQKQALAAATDFVSWCAAARELDRLEGRDEWKRTDESPYYDYQLIREHIANLTKFRNERDFDGLLALLKLIYSTPNVGGINNHSLYNQTHFGTKTLVHDFIQVVLECTMIVRDAQELSLQQRCDFFRRARRWYGRTALMLSGGAAMGYYHTGVIKTLIEARCMPQVLSGASAGSLMCAFLAVRTDQEVLQDLCRPEGEKYFRACQEPFLVKFSRWLRHGYSFDQVQWREQLRQKITKGDTTFLEAYQKYGRIINIAVTSSQKYAPTLILNYRSTPDVVIWSAVLASSAFPNFLAPVELQIKNPRTHELEAFHVHGRTFADGTIKNDIPIKEMQKMWQANYFVVSQVNPHLVPFFYGQRGGSGRPAPRLTKNTSSGLRGGFILAMFEKLLKLEIKKWFKLISDLDIMPLVFGTDWRFIYLQRLTGTVTIVPDAPLWAYFRVVSDPNRETMAHYLQTGERATWYKLCRIANHYRLEKALIECSRYLDAEAKKQGLHVPREKLSHVNAGVTETERRKGATTNADAQHAAASDQLATKFDANGSSTTTTASSSAAPTTRRRSNRRASTKKKAFAQLGAPIAAAASDSDSLPVPRSRDPSSDSSREPTDSRSQVERALFHLRGSPALNASTVPASASASLHATSRSLHSDDEEDVVVADASEVLPDDALPPTQTQTADILGQDITLWRRGLDTDIDTDTDQAPTDDDREREEQSSEW